MNTVQTLKEKALQGVSITKEEALSLADQPLDELCQAANELREHFAPLSTEKAASVLKTANTAHNLPIPVPLWKSIHF